MQRDLGCGVSHHCMPMPDINPTNFIAGALARFGGAVPRIAKGRLSFLRSFTRNFMRATFRRLRDSDIPSFHDWLASRSYPDWRKRQLFHTYHRYVSVNPKIHFGNKSFVKTEQYPSYKWPRAINSRHDMFKCATGPLFSAMEKVVFENKFFVKHIDVDKYPQHIMASLEGVDGQIVTTDFEKFEKHFVPEILHAVELQVYAYLLGGTRGEAAMPMIAKALAGRNHCTCYRHGKKVARVSLNGVRMSGDMCTSLGNGLTNLILMHAVCAFHGSKVTGGAVEGDDGVFKILGYVPTAADFADFGFTIKIEKHDRLQDAGFCKKYFDEHVLDNVVDPAELLVKFGWTHSLQRLGNQHTLAALLRAKADSLESVLPGAPLVGSLVHFVRRVLGDGSRKLTSGQDWCHNVAHGVLHPVALASRLVVERVFKVPVETQLHIERYLDSLGRLQPFDDPVILDLMHPDWSDYYEKYVVDLPRYDNLPL